MSNMVRKKQRTFSRKLGKVIPIGVLEDPDPYSDEGYVTHIGGCSTWLPFTDANTSTVNVGRVIDTHIDMLISAFFAGETPEAEKVLRVWGVL